MTAIPITHPAASRHILRQQLTRLISRLIDTLDEIDGDPDFEDVGDNEPSLSAAVPQTTFYGSQDAWLQGVDDDREDACEDEGAQCDDEGAFDGDNDTSDYEASLCGITFSANGAQLDG